MKTEKKLGVYLDHAQARFVNYAADSENLETIDSDFTHFEKEKTLSKSESGMHNKEQQELGSFFKKISKVIMDFDNVLLFGPTDAKVELFNYLQSEHKYSKIKMEVRNTDKLTENQEIDFVKNHFEHL
jgi:stalled ribosome rescue protein Dom34